MSINVMFCCNDPNNGVFTGSCIGVELEDSDTLSLNPHVFDETGDAVGVPIEVAGNRVVIAGEAFEIRGWSSHVGNWCWDMGHMPLVEVVRLLDHLKKQEYEPDVPVFDCDSGECSLYDAWHEGRSITADMIRAAMEPAANDEMRDGERKTTANTTTNL